MRCLVLTKICLNKYKTLRRSENDKVFSFWHILIDLASIFSPSLSLSLNPATAILFAAVSCHGKPQACQGFFCASQEQQARNADKKYFTLSYNKNFITIFAVNDVEDERRVQRVRGRWDFYFACCSFCRLLLHRCAFAVAVAIVLRCVAFK